MSRMLAAKTALAIRVDALGEDTNAELGLEHRAKLERRVRELEEGKVSRRHVFLQRECTKGVHTLFLKLKLEKCQN